MGQQEGPGDEVGVQGPDPLRNEPQAEVLQELPTQTVPPEGQGHHEPVQVSDRGLQELVGDPGHDPLVRVDGQEVAGLVRKAQGHSRLQIQPVQPADLRRVDGLPRRVPLALVVPDMGGHHHLPPSLPPYGQDVHDPGSATCGEHHVTEDQAIGVLLEGGLELRKLNHVSRLLAQVAEHPLQKPVKGPGYVGPQGGEVRLPVEGVPAHVPVGVQLVELVELGDLPLPGEGRGPGVGAGPIRVALHGAQEGQGHPVLVVQLLQVSFQSLPEPPVGIQVRFRVLLQGGLELHQEGSPVLRSQGLHHPVKKPANVQIASGLGVVAGGWEEEVLHDGANQRERPVVGPPVRQGKDGPPGAEVRGWHHDVGGRKGTRHDGTVAVLPTPEEGGNPPDEEVSPMLGRGLELQIRLPREGSDPFPHSQVVHQGHGERTQVRPVAAEGTNHRRSVHAPPQRQHPEGGLQEVRLLTVRGRPQEEVIVLPRPGVDAHAVDLGLEKGEYWSDPDPVGGDLVHLDPTVVEGQHDGLVEERRAHQGPVDDPDLGLRDPVVEHDLPFPPVRLVVRCPSLQVLLKPFHNLFQVLPGDPRQLGIRQVQDPAHQLGSDLDVVIRVMPHKGGQQGEHPLHLMAKSLGRRPLQLDPISVKSPPQSLQPDRLDPGVGDGFDAPFREEGESGREEGRDLQGVVRHGTHQEEDPVSQGPDLQVGVTGQSLQPSVDDSAQTYVRLLEEPFQGPDGPQSIRSGCEEGRGAETIYLRQPRIPDGRGRHRHLRGVVPLLPPGDEDLGGHGLQREIPALLAGAEGDEGGIRHPEHGLSGKDPQVHQPSFHTVLQVPHSHRPAVGVEGHGQEPVGAPIPQPLLLGDDIRFQDSQVPEEPPGNPYLQAVHLQLDVVGPVEPPDHVLEVLLDGFALERPFGS